MSSPLLKLDGLRNKLNIVVLEPRRGSRKHHQENEKERVSARCCWKWGRVSSWINTMNFQSASTLRKLCRYVNLLGSWQVKASCLSVWVSGDIRQMRCMKLKLSSVLLVWGSSWGFAHSSLRLRYISEVCCSQRWERRTFSASALGKEQRNICLHLWNELN